MSDTPKTDKESMWVVDGTGEYIKCIHIDEAREMETVLREARRVLDDWCDEYGHAELEKMRDKIDKYLDS